MDGAARPVPLRSSRRPQAPARLPRGSTSAASPRARRSCRATSRRSNIPIAGSTTRGWWCSNALDARERGAAILTRTLVVGAARRRAVAARRIVDAAERRTATRSRRARWSTPPGHGSSGSSIASTARIRSSRVRLVKGSHIVAPKFFDGRAGLSAAEPRRARDLRHPLRGRPRADRHDRHSVRRRAGDGRRRRSGDRLSARRRRRLFPQSARGAPTSSKPMPACGRCSTTAPATRRR